MISAATIAILIDAGLSGETLKAVTAAIENDVAKTCNMLRERVRNDVTLSDAGSVTPAALRMRKMREKQMVDAKTSAVTESVTERNSVTSQSVTSDINLTSKKDGFEESKKVVNARARKNYSELFETFWGAYPTDPGMSKAEASKTWGRLTPEDQQAAVDGIPAFKAWATKQGTEYRIVHACRYLSQRRFEGFKAEAEKAKETLVNGRVYVKAGTPAGDAWDAFLKTQGKPPKRDFNGGWWFPSEFPETEQRAIKA